VIKDAGVTEIPGLIEAADRLARRDISSVELTQSALEHIAKLNPLLNAYITVLADEALAAAAQADQEIESGAYRGALHGIPLSVKDLFWTAGTRTTAGSRVLSEFVPREDATLVQRVRQAGGVIIGKANMLEFAYASFHPDYGPTKNPWSLQRTAMGSSGGSAAAVTSGMDFGSYGSDTGGSIRVPSSFCGATGLKPTYGRASVHGVVPLSSTLDHVGPMARSVADLARLLQPIVGPDPLDPSSASAEIPDYGAALDTSLGGLKAALVTNFMGDGVTPEVRAAVAHAADTLVQAGVQLTELAIPELGERAIEAYLPILFAEASHAHRHWLQDRRADYSAGVLARLDDGLQVSAVSYLAAMGERRHIRDSVRERQRSIDLLVMPTTAMAAWPLEATDIPVGEREEELRSIIRFTSPFDLTGLPALSVPCGFTDGGLPIGLQLVGREFEETVLLRAGFAFQARTMWHRRPPPYSVASAL
jgi:Asp-tRNA(Asn)/Glu-tRNA(Gln) amidotransferase A subunit family amidase